MKHATLARLTALSLLGSATFALAQQSPRPAPQAPAAAPAEQAPQAESPAPQAQPQPPQAQSQAPQAGPARPAPGGGRAERRRPSYASCNRASHQRGLQGGRRRRFLIRCRLGYERPRQPPAVRGAAPQPPAQPGPRP